jgi:hypothetical protein
MRTLFKKWRLVRWIYRELYGHEKKQNMASPGQAMLLSKQAAVDEFAKRRRRRLLLKRWFWTDRVDIRRVLEKSIEEGYLIDQADSSDGPSLKVSSTKGYDFEPVFSGLLITALRELGPLWAFLSGGGLVLILGAIAWILHAL